MNASAPSPLGSLLITGAAARLGRVIALEAARMGFDVCIHVHTSSEAGDALAQEIQSMGRTAACLSADLEDPCAVQSLVRQACAALGGRPLAGLINNASLFLPDSEDPTGARHDQINYRAPLALIKALADSLPPAQEGSVVNLLDGTLNEPSFSAYASSKEALRAEVPALALAYAPHLRINAVEPGPTLRGVRQSAAHFQTHIDATLLRRATPPLDVARAVLFLFTNPSITGAILPVDAGYLAKNPTNARALSHGL